MSNQKTAGFLRRAFVQMIFKRLLLVFIITSFLYTSVAVVYATRTLFKVKMNYSVVLEKLGGKREAVTEVGWHIRLPFFTRIEQEVSLMNQTLFLGGKNEPTRVISKENVALWTSAVMTYRITDLRTWAIENLDPMTLLQGDHDGIVKDILQAQKINALISDREFIKEKIFRALKSRPINERGPTLEQKYGIKVVSFVLKETRFGDKLIEATEEKKRRELIAEAENYAADQEAARIRKLYAAYQESFQKIQAQIGGKSEAVNLALLRFLTQQKWASAYEKNQSGQHTVVIQNTGSSPALTLPSGPQK